MGTSRLSSRIILIVLSIMLLSLTGGMAWATVNEFQARTTVAKGVSVNGHDLSGMSEAEARSIITQAVSEPLLRPVMIDIDGDGYSFDPADSVHVDVDAMVSDALAPRRQVSFPARLRHDFIGTPLTSEVQPAYSVDIDAVTKWVEDLAEKANRPALDASVTVTVGGSSLAAEASSNTKASKSKKAQASAEASSSAKADASGSGDSAQAQRAGGPGIIIEPSKVGITVRVKESADLIVDAFATKDALSGDDRTIEIAVDKIEPEVTEKRFERVLLVRLSERRVRLFVNGKLEKSYPCAIGTASYPTPRGNFEITEKRYRPTWVNPAPNGWGSNMPPRIAPGPGNPLGTRAINISASGIRFHGTENIRSVGTAASHGCMRMYRGDIEDMFDRVEVGDKVYIVR